MIANFYKSTSCFHFIINLRLCLILIKTALIIYWTGVRIETIVYEKLYFKVIRSRKHLRL